MSTETRNQFVMEGVVLAQPTRREIGKGVMTEILLEVDDSYNDREGNCVSRRMAVPVETWQSTLPPGISKGAIIKVRGRVKAREWTKPETMEVKRFTSLNFSEVKVIKPAQESAKTPEHSMDDIPF